MVKSTLYTALVMAALMVSCEPAEARDPCQPLLDAIQYNEWLECRTYYRMADVQYGLDRATINQLHQDVIDIEADLDTLMDTVEDIEYEHRNRW